MSGDELTRLREAFASADNITGDGSECPNANTLAASACGTLHGQDNEAVLLHTAECGACATAWRLARDLLNTDRPAVRSHSHALRWMAAAAMIFVAISALVLLQQWQQADAPVSPGFRAPQQQGPSATIEVVQRNDPVLRWTAGPEGATYDIRVTTEDLQPIAVAWRIMEPWLRLDPEILDAVPDGAFLHWQVTEHHPDGRVIDSPTFTTAVK